MNPEIPFCVADCLQRALGLLNGCQPFLNALNANGGQLSKFTIFQILQLAIQNKTADLTCAKLQPRCCFAKKTVYERHVSILL